MKFFIKLIFSIVLLLIFKTTFSQTDIIENDKAFSQSDLDKYVYAENYEQNLLQAIVLAQLNRQLIFNNKEPLMLSKLLKNAAEDQAEYMAFHEDSRIEQSGKKSSTQDRLIFYDGSGFGSEYVQKFNTSKGKEPYTYKQLADEIVFKWFNTKKSMELITDSKFMLIGIGIKLDEIGRRAYVSIVLGNYKSYNYGANRKNELDIPYTTKRYGLFPYDDRACKSCNKFKNIERLNNGLFVRDGKIYFKHDNLKEIKRLIRKPKDGLAVDIIQKEQFSCIGDNIIDNRLINKGILLKRVYSNKLYKKNLITGKKIKSIEVEIGTLPKDINGDYELNLLIIQNKNVCRNLSKTYLVDAGIEYSTTIRLLADTVLIEGVDVFNPIAENAILTFKIPFEKNKYTYKAEDIEPFLKLLNEPDFLIDKLKISAYSSIEGGESENKILQEKRAQSIIDALKTKQKANVKKEIFTSENYDEFKNDVTGTAYDNLSKMTLDEAKEYIKSNKLQKPLESILANHRYATIEMDITYDIAGIKEEAYVISRLNKAIKNNNYPLALSIQKFIFKKVLNDNYSKDAVYKQNIPNLKECAGLLMNKLWLEKYVENDDVDDVVCDKINAISQLDPFNSYILYNKLFCHILHNPLGDDRQIQEYQDKIMELYFTTLSKPTVDALNLEYQFKIIETLDTLDTPHPLLVESLERIKEIVNLKEANWQNSLKLAYLFTKQNDFEFAAKLLEPFIDNSVVFEELIFTYISVCTYTPHRIYSNKFARALERANELNPERYCKLFDGKQLSLQVLENEKVKTYYCKNCKK